MTAFVGDGHRLQVYARGTGSKTPNSRVTDAVTAVTNALSFDIVAAWTGFTIGPNGYPC